MVTIDGEYFCQQPEADEPDVFACASMGGVLFDTTTATAVQYRDRVTVNVAGRTSSSVTFTVE